MSDVLPLLLVLALIAGWIAALIYLLERDGE